MTQLTRGAALEGPADAVTETDGLLFSPWEALEWLWRVFTSMRTALVLILGLSLFALLGTVIAQVPAGLAADPPAYDAWLEAMRGKYGGWTGVMDKLGLFAVFQSLWFRFALVLLTTSILACSINRSRGLWRLAVHPRVAVTDHFYDSAPLRAAVQTESTVESALDAVRRVFRGQRFRTIVERDGDAAHLYVDRNRFSPFGTVIAHLSVVLILVGALMSSMLGFRNSELAVTVGTTAEVGGGTGLSVLAKSFSDSYYEDGRPSDYASQLVVYRDGAPVAEKTVRVNEPLEYGGVTFYQSFFGPAAVMQVADAAGQVLYQGGVPLLWSSDDSTRRIGRFLLQDGGLLVYVVGAASGRVDQSIRPGQMQLEIYRSDEQQPFAIEVISQGAPLTIGDLAYTFQREQQFTGLIVATDPGAPFVWLGALALVAGLCLIYMFPARRIWIAVRSRAHAGGVVRLGATAHHDATFTPEFNRLVEQVRLTLEPAGKQ
jgi:cytochrome c biogenesis protein